MAVTVLKKYTVTERDIAMDDALKGYAFFVVAGNMTLPVVKEQLSTIFNNAPAVYGYLDVPFPLRITNLIPHNDFTGAVQFDFIFESTIAVNEKLGQFILLNSSKESWSDEELGKHVSEELKNSLAVWLSERTIATPLSNLKSFKADSFTTPEERASLGEKLPGFIKGTFKDLGVTLLSSAEPDIFAEKVRELMKWCAENGIKPDVSGTVINNSPTLEIAKGKLEEIIQAGKKGAYKEKAEELTAWAETQGIRQEDAWEIINNAGTLKEAEAILKEKAKGNVIVDEVRKLKEWARSQGLKDEDTESALASGSTIAGAKAILEDMLEYQRRLDTLLTRIVNECGLPRGLALQKLGEAKGNLRILEEIANEIFRVHAAALQFKERFKFDAITGVYEEFENCGGPRKAMEIWENAEKLRKIIPEYARKSMKECVAFTRKVSPEVVEQMIKEYRPPCSPWGKRFGVLFVILLFAAGIFFGLRALRTTFVLEILTGNGAELESTVFNAFGKGFEYKNNSYSITSSKGAKLRFIDELRAKGHTVTAVSPEKYSVSLAAPAGNKKENWKVDSSMFRSDANSLTLFRRCLGSGVNGGKADVITISREELNKAQQTLDDAGFLVSAADGLVTITVKTSSFRIRTAPEVAPAVKEILRGFNITNPDEVVMAAVSVNALLDALSRDSRLGKVEFIGNELKISAPVMNVFSVAVQLNSSAEYEKVQQIIGGVKEVRIDSAKLVDHAGVVTIAEFKIGSMARSAAQLKELICGALSGKINNFRDRNVKVR